jgi:hypothetical protein
MKKGILVRWSSFWIGLHWSRHNRRLCINLFPCFTIWIVFDGGITPTGEWVHRPRPSLPGMACQRCGRCRDGDFAHCKARR